jgi:hypothetical protein
MDLERALELLEDTRKSNDHWLKKYREAEARIDAVMLAWYKANPGHCADYCDTVFDRSGAYLGVLRARARGRS